MKKTILFLQAAVVGLLAACNQPSDEEQLRNEIQYVNPFIGTGFHGHTFPGATRPFALVQVSPDTHIMAGMPVADTIMMTTKYMLSAIHTYQVRVSATWEMWRSYLSPVVTRSNRLRFSRKRRKKQRQAIMQYVSTISELMWS